MARQPTVPLEHRLAWTLPEFAAVYGRSYDWVHDRTTWPQPHDGYIDLPGGIRCPVHRTPDGWAVVHRLEYELAITDAYRRGGIHPEAGQ